MSPKQLEHLVDSVTDYVMDWCAPSKMSPAEATDFLEQIRDYCQLTIDALKEDMENE
jgi:hypothetical protein